MGEREGFKVVFVGLAKNKSISKGMEGEGKGERRRT